MRLEGVGKAKEVEKLEGKMKKGTSHLESASKWRAVCLSVCLSVIHVV